MTEQWLQDFADHAIYRNDENTGRITRCLALLPDADVWRKPNEASNSVGNLILHLCGNIRQYIIASVGQKEDKRERDKEFAATGGYLKEQLIQLLQETVREANTVIRSATELEMLRKRSVQGYYFSGIGAVMHAVEHYSYHTGQIAFWVKQLTNTDLGFYKGVDLSVRNK